MSMKKQRRKFSAQQKVQMLRQHLVEKVPISEVCESQGISPTQFYQWQKVFFEHGTAAFERAGNGRKDGPDKKLEKKLSHLQTKLAHKDEVIAEIMASHVALKKSLGED
jgi:transposase-like protein